MTGTDQHNLTLSNGELGSLKTLLETQRVRRLDLIADAPKLGYDGGRLYVESDEQVLTSEGVTNAGGWYEPTRVFDEGLGETFGINRQFMRKLRDENRIELLDQVVNHFTRGSRDGNNPPDGRKFLTRLFRGDDTGGGIARAFLSDRYKPIDNLDMLVATLDGIRQAGIEVKIGRCDVTERRMYVQVAAPQVAVLAPELLRGYRSPFTGAEGADNPTVFAGFVISNSETGGGAATLTPRITVRVCSNGMTITRDAVRAVHLGGRREEGIVQYSDDTMEKELAVAAAKTRDAVATFIDAEYVARKVREMEQQAGVPVTKPEATVKAVVQAAGLPKSLEDDVFASFIQGGQLTAGGIMQAVTATAQTVENADQAYELEGMATDVLAHAARIARAETA